MPALMLIAESRPETCAGAAGCAFGSQTWNGMKPALMPKPAKPVSRTSANAFGIVGRVTREIFEVPTARQFMQREETDVEQKDAGVRRHQIPKTAAADFLFVLVEDNREVSADGHGFPRR